MKKERNLAFIFIVLVLILSWLVTYLLFQDQSTIELYPLIMFIPAIVGITLNSIRFRSFRKVFKPITRKVSLKSLIFAFLYPILFIGSIAVIISLSGIGSLNTDKLSSLKDIPTIETIILGALLMFGEEYGWRGFLLPELCLKFGKIKSALLVGLIWALWHAPAVYGLALHTEMSSPILMTFLQMGAVFVFSIPFAYSYFLSGSILPPMIFHFVWNFYNPMVLGSVYGNKQGIIEGELLLINGEGLSGIVLGLLFVFWFIHKYTRKFLPKV